MKMAVKFRSIEMIHDISIVLFIIIDISFFTDNQTFEFIENFVRFSVFIIILLFVIHHHQCFFFLLLATIIEFFNQNPNEYLSVEKPEKKLPKFNFSILNEYNKNNNDNPNNEKPARPVGFFPPSPPPPPHSHTHTPFIHKLI